MTGRTYNTRKRILVSGGAGRWFGGMNRLPVAMLSSLLYFQASSWLQRWLSEQPGTDANVDWMAEMLGQTEVQTLVVAVLTIVTWLIVTFVSA